MMVMSNEWDGAGCLRWRICIGWRMDGYSMSDGNEVYVDPALSFT